MSNPLKKDPTRTTTLRRRFMADMKRRMRLLKTAVKDLVVDKDVFGLKKTDPLKFNVAEREWRFNSNPDKLDNFNKWFKQQTDQKLLSVTGPANTPWTSEYVESSYRKGALRAYTDNHKEELAISPDFYLGSREQFLKTVFGQPEMVSKLKLVYTRVFEELKGITSAMSQQVSRVLADGLANGRGALEIARNMANTVDGITRKRALVLARTEVIRAHAEGQLDSFELLGVEKLGVEVEWSTAGDEKVCPLCSPLEGKIYTIEEARGMIPRHPNCRCAWIPAVPDDIEDKLDAEDRAAFKKKKPAVKSSVESYAKNLNKILSKDEIEITQKEMDKYFKLLRKKGGLTQEFEENWGFANLKNPLEEEARIDIMNAIMRWNGSSREFKINAEKILQGHISDISKSKARQNFVMEMLAGNSEGKMPKYVVRGVQDDLSALKIGEIYDIPTASSFSTAKIPNASEVAKKFRGQSTIIIHKPKRGASILNHWRALPEEREFISSGNFELFQITKNDSLNTIEYHFRPI